MAGLLFVVIVAVAVVIVVSAVCLFAYLDGRRNRDNQIKVDSGGGNPLFALMDRFYWWGTGVSKDAWEKEWRAWLGLDKR